MKPGVVYELNGREWLCTDVNDAGTVFLTAVQMRYGKWAHCFGPGSATHLKYEYNARPAKHQTGAKIRLWASWNVAPRVRRVRKALAA